MGQKPGKQSKPYGRIGLEHNRGPSTMQAKTTERLQTRRWQASLREPAVAGQRTRRLPPRPVKRRQCDGRITPGGVRMRKHHNKWQRLNKWWDHLFNNKRDTESVAEGATELHLTIQRLIPAPRKRKGKRNLRVINLGT